MDFINQLQNWTKGDTIQGRIMIGAGVILSFITYFIFLSENGLLKGMFIPMSLLLVMNLSYGGFLLMTKPEYSQRTEAQFAQNAELTIKRELEKARADDRNYTTFRVIWAVLIVASVIAHFIFSKEYLKGLSLGFIVMFLGTLLIDTFLQSRLKLYVAFLDIIVLKQSF